MSSTTQDEEADNARIMLGLLESVDRDAGQSQRRLASELGIALGLVNAYLKRCVKKGLVKVGDAPARRYAYYLTPQGFAEKSRLTVEYLSYSFSFFRRARGECADIFEAARSRGVTRVVVAGASDLAEIARICALESGVEIIAIVDKHISSATYLGLPVVRELGDVSGEYGAVIVTDLRNAQATFNAMIVVAGRDRVVAPKLLNLREHGSGRPAE